MKNLFFAFGCAAILAATTNHLAGETQVSLTQGTSGSWNVDWNGATERTDFLQWSTDLIEWHWAPLVEYHTGAKSYGFLSSTEKYFLRLQHAYIPSSDPEGDDYDYDNLTNIDEVTLHDTDPLNWDTDGDGMEDSWEINNFLDPRDNGSVDPNNGPDGDPDNDGLPNLFESWYGSNPHLAHSDNDGINDGDEVFFYNTNPTLDDSDYDGLNDFDELNVHGTDPIKWDSDEDTLNDGSEITVHATNPLKMDTDGDWMWDDWEIDHQLNPNNPADGLLDADSDGLLNQLEFVFRDDGFDAFTSDAANFPWDGDPDYDGMTTAIEFNTHLTNPKQPDTDEDGMDDEWEISVGFNARLHNSQDANPDNDENADPDGDNLTNGAESSYGTNPNNPDTDGDGVNDDVEINQGTNPNDPNDHDPPPQGTMAVSVEFGDPSGSHSEKYRVRLQPVEGDTQVRERTNRKYGQTQTDTFQLPKGAKYTVTLVHTGTDPKYRDEPKPDYDYTLEFTTSNTDAAAALVTDDQQGILGSHNESEQFYAAGKTAYLFTALMTSETTATLPTDRKRTKLGVTETVQLTLHPSSLPNPTWQITGNKHLSSLTPTTGITSLMTVEMDPCQPVSEATINGKVVKLTFNVVEPDGIVMRQQPGSGIEHTQGIPSAGFTGNPYITPNDVSFASGRVEVREQTCVAVATGYYSYQSGDVHQVGPFRTIVAGDATNPNKVNTSDHIYSGNNGPATPSVGSFDWVIPMEFRVTGWQTKQFTTITHHHESDANGTVSITKGAGPFSAQLNDPTYP